MTRYLFVVLLALFAGILNVAHAGSVPVIVHTGSAAHTSSEEDDAVASSGRPISITATTRIEYVPALRVWYDTTGTLLVCRAPGETYTHSSKRCELANNKNVQAGWAPLPSLQLPGHVLGAVQVNETKNGPSLVLYWRAVPARKP